MAINLSVFKGANSHMVFAGGLYALGKLVCPILAIWFPGYKVQLDATAPYLESAAIFYGFSMAGHATPWNAQNTTSSTPTVLVKP